MAIQGIFAVLKYKVGGFADPAAWSDLTNVKDVVTSLTSGEADFTSRANQGWKSTLTTLNEATIEFEMIWEPADPGFLAIRDAYLNRTIIGLAPLDSAGAAGDGIVADWSISSFSIPQPLEEVITVSVTAKLSKFNVWTTTGV